MSLKHALLGLLSERDATGYDLTKLFELSMSHYWHASHSQIYPLLDGMKKDGFIREKRIVRKDRSRKKVYQLTPEGCETLLAWLQAPSPLPRLKDEMMLKARFFGRLDDVRAIALLRGQQSAHQAKLDEYLKIEATYFPGAQEAPPSSRSLLFAYFTLRRGILHEEDSVRWCRWAIGQVRKSKLQTPLPVDSFVDKGVHKAVDQSPDEERSETDSRTYRGEGKK
jgi:DNA-binding PadR family transcriptional regulator